LKPILRPEMAAFFVPMPRKGGKREEQTLSGGEGRTRRPKEAVDSPGGGGKCDEQEIKL